MADAEEDVPASSVSREHRTYRDTSGLLSTAGGKLTTYRAMGEEIVDEVVRRLPDSRRRALSPSRTAELPLRVDDFDREELQDELCRRFDLARHHTAHLARTYGEQARTLLEQAPPELRCPIGTSRFVLAEIAWSFAMECPASLCDLLEHRLRMAVFAVGQGLSEISRIAPVAAAAADWDEERTRAEIEAYADAVRRRYQIAAPNVELSAA
jgi:glycerol-3-phosphate dehydrogenase